MYTLLVTINVENFELFEEFELNASRIMKSYGGTILKAFEIERQDDGSGKEVHLVQFSDRDSFERYRHDEELESIRTMQFNAVSGMNAVVLGTEKLY